MQIRLFRTWFLDRGSSARFNQGSGDYRRTKLWIPGRFRGRTGTRISFRTNYYRVPDPRFALATRSSGTDRVRESMVSFNPIDQFDAGQ